MQKRMYFMFEARDIFQTSQSYVKNVQQVSNFQTWKFGHNLFRASVVKDSERITCKHSFRVSCFKVNGKMGKPLEAYL